MKKKIIVKTHREFNNIINKGKKINSKYFVIYYDKNNLNISRYGISVGTKLGNAVFRNKYKRKIRSIIDSNSTIKEYKKDFIIILKKSGSNKKYKDLKEDLDNLVLKIKGELNEK